MAVTIQNPPMPLSATTSDDTTLPELQPDSYYLEVLHLTTTNFESYLDNLVHRAKLLGVSSSRPGTSTSTSDKRNVSGAESSITLDTNHARTASTSSDGSDNTMLTAYSSRDGKRDSAGLMLSRKRSRSLSFSQYDVYASQIAPNLDQPKITSLPSPEPDSTHSVFSHGTRKSFVTFRKGLSKMRRKKTTPRPESLYISCSACRDDLGPEETLMKLPCGHSYCPKCLNIMITQSATDESKMPPRCCTQPIPGFVVKSVLSREDQQHFLKAVLQFSTPWESRVFCSNTKCGEFIPPPAKLDPKHPFQAVCRKCGTRVCVTCKRDAHPLGKDCPGDLELDAVLKVGEKSGWRRCYKCKTLVELGEGCTHITCRCRAQFCYICGAVWDPTIGCPNVCNGEEEMERRRVEEEARVAAQEAEEIAKQKEAEREVDAAKEAEERSRSCEEFKVLHATQLEEMDRFQTFERKSKWLMWARHAQQKLALTEKHSSAMEKMKERHTKTSSNLEDRQVAAEMELRSTLEQSEKNVRVRLKHMEAYCDGLGQNPTGEMPSRVVTERDLRELGQQYTLEKNMKQLHQSKINVMRDRQAKTFEDLMDRQEQEFERATDKNAKEMENLEAEFSDEEDTLLTTFAERRANLTKRWELCLEILRKELQAENRQRYGPMELPQWPQSEPASVRSSEPASVPASVPASEPASEPSSEPPSMPTSAPPSVPTSEPGPEPLDDDSSTSHTTPTTTPNGQ